jgi:hypothetical protein
MIRIGTTWTTGIKHKPLSFQEKLDILNMVMLLKMFLTEKIAEELGIFMSP